MKYLKGKTAVVTGAAGGIGFALASACALRGARVVLADVEERRLRDALRKLTETGADAIALRIDVSKEEDVQRLAKETIAQFGEAHLLFNNAGVGAGSLIWNSTTLDWRWTLGVNLWGAIHAVNAFVPLMMRQDCECRIINTASRAGLENGPFNGIYRVSKHALVAFSETLHHELEIVGSKIRVSVLCPGTTRTGICDADRNRPDSLRNSGGDEYLEAAKPVLAMIRSAVEAGADPGEVAEYTLKAIAEDRFYILPDPIVKPLVMRRAENIVNECSPEFDAKSAV